ncbi:uncharacterized protein LOC125000721 isoform X6 [Mugil cephalus]|uniref:uncharacterized protein LOC125000721 isoform X6 n=1 Tax=Mugil cephalus TaxID=48193 RepID=UPI001FB7227D|nr:uncharacterized protein LOC125000721 isoform X6 [Mugil cephalus]
MACTTQSALDYVRSARIHLVGEFKNLSVILENLYQKNVLSDEEVSKIQAERDDYDKTRKILDSVIKKGEAACYELLRIIDTTRKRTLKSDASTEARKFDLHHWISCFSFKEDPQGDINNLQGPKSCHRYQAKLKSKARRLSNEFWMTSRKLFAEKKLDLSYTSLVLDTQDNVSPSKIKKFKRKKSKMIRPKKLRTYIPEDKAEISPSDLLKTYKNIVLVGKPGIGKTALTHEVLRLWAERDNKELDYMFYFDMRETSNITAARSLEELLFNVSIGPEEGAEEVLDDMKRNSDNVTIILDGITDLCSSVVKRLVEKDLLPDAKIILTCRPADEEDFFYGDCVRVEVKGFSEQTIRSYLSAALGEEQEKIVTNLELVTLCHVPVYALMVAACFSSGGSPQPCTETEIYINIVRHCLQINSNKTKNKDLNSFISTNKNEILSLAEVAFLATRGKTVNLTEVSCEDSCVLSFLKPLLIKAACTETETIYAFLHYTVQEFFAALWLLKNPDQIRDVLKQCLTEEMRHMKHLIPFMCRLLSERKPTLMRLLIPADDLKNTSDWFLKEMITTFSPGLKKQGVDDSEDSGLNVDILFLCQCLYESQSPEACIYLLDRLDYQLDLSEESLDCSPCCALAYVLSQHKERKAQLNLEDATISEQGMRQLFGCLENVQWCDPLPQQLWKIFLLSDRQMDYVTLLGKAGNQLHLPVEGKRRLFDRAVEVMQRMTKKMNKKVNVCLYGDRVTSVCQNLCESLLQALPYISSLSFNSQTSEPSEETRVFGNLFCAAAERENQTGEKIVELLSSVCRYKTFPLKQRWCDFLLDLYSDKTETGLRLLPSFQSVFQSPTVWSIDLSERKTSILLEVMKLQSEKKPVELRVCSHGESEVRSFLQCLPYISQLRFYPQSSYLHQQTRFLSNLFCAATETENQTGEEIVELLSSVCTYQTFPLDEDYMSYYKKYPCNFLLDLFSHVKDYETKTGPRLLPSFQSVFQSPTVWFIDLSERKTSILLEVMKLQSEKKPVELRVCSHGESEVRSFLQCLPYISQLSCPPEFFQSVCSSISVRSREDVHQLSSLLQLLDFNLILTGKLRRKTCCSVGRVLHLCGSKVDLTLTALKMSVRGASNLFRRTTCLHSLRLSNNMVPFLCQWIRRGRLVCPLVVEELHLVPQTVQPSDRLMLEVVSSLSSLLRYWTVRLLDLTESCISAQCLMSLLLHDGPLTLKLSEEILQQLLTLVHEVQDKHLTLSLLSKVGGDLSSCRLDWELLHYLLQSSDQIITVNLRKNRFLQENTTRLLPFLDRMVLTRPSPSFVMTSIRELYRAQAGLSVPGLLRSLDHVISLSCRELDSVDCAALLFVLKHSDRVKLNLLWTSIPGEGLQSILSALDRVSQLSVDRNQLLRFIHCCAASDDQQGASSGLLRTLQHSLDLSCSSCVETPEEAQTESLSLTGDDCRVVSTVLRHSSMDTQLDLRHCEVEDSGLELLFPVLDRVHLRVSKTVLLQLVSLVPVHSEEDTVRRAVSLCGALGGELDLSHSRLDQRTCGALVQMLEFSEGLTELDLSHCQLTDQLLLPLSSQLHKVQVLDLSHNQITDASTDLLLQLPSINPSIHTVRLFSNKIKDRTPFKKHQHFEIW